jgi:hypothetical protein
MRIAIDCCKHGQLAKDCVICDLEKQLAEREKQIVMLKVALSEIAWSNDSKWQSDRALDALNGGLRL